MYRTVTALAVTALLAAGCSGNADEGASDSPDSASTVIRAGVTPPFFNNVPRDIADAQGLYSDAGLEMEYTEMVGQAPQLAALVSDSVDVVQQSPAIAALAAAQDSDVRIFCGTIDRSTLSVHAGADVDVQTVEEAGSWEAAVQSWAGKSIGVSGLKGAGQLLVEAILSEAGMKPSDVDFVNAGVGQAMSTALDQGAVDMIAAWPFLTLQLADDTTKVFDQMVDGPAEMSKQASGVWMAKAEWLEKNADAAQALCDVWRESTAYMQDPANADEVAGILSEKHGLTADQSALALADDGPLSIITADVDCEAVDNLLDSTRAAGGIPEGVDATCQDLLWQP